MKFATGLFALLSCLLGAHCIRDFPSPNVGNLLALIALLPEENSSAAATYTLGGTVSGLTGTLALTNNSTDSLTITANGSFTFSGAYGDGATYSVAVSSVSGTQQCVASSADGTISGANVSSIVVNCYSVFSLAGAPTVGGSSPANAATTVPTCTGSICRARVQLRFDESMNSALTPAVTATIDGTNANVTAFLDGWTHTNYVDDTVDMNLSWTHFPENTTITLDFTAANLQDRGGTALAVNHSVSFTTGAGFYYATADSGQTQCSDGTVFGACPQGGFFGQDGDYPNNKLPARSFSAPSNAAFAADYTTTDNVTGLVWTTCPEGMTFNGTNCTGTPTAYTWHNALDSCSTLNTANGGTGYGGQRGWRVPTAREMRTLINFGNAAAPFQDAGAFDTNPATASYWTATSAFTAGLGRRILFGTAQESASPKALPANLRCVRGSGSSSKSYTDNGNETVTDHQTGLVWTRCLRGQAGATCTGAASINNLSGAANDCEGLAFGGRTDWRLPGVAEVHTILDDAGGGTGTHSFNQTFFPTAATTPKTSTSDPLNATNQTHIGVTSGVTQFNNTPLEYRCVAGP